MAPGGSIHCHAGGKEGRATPAFQRGAAEADRKGASDTLPVERIGLFAVSLATFLERTLSRPPVRWLRALGVRGLVGRLPDFAAFHPS